MPPDVWSTLNRLIESSLASLRQTLEIHLATRQALTGAKRQELTRRREALLDEVELSIGHIATALDEVRALSLNSADPAGGLADLRRELAVSLDIAKRVEQRVADLDREVTGPRRERERE